MKTVVVEGVHVLCRPMCVTLSFTHDPVKKEYWVRIDTKTESVKLPGFVFRRQGITKRVEFDDGRVQSIEKGKWVAFSYDFHGPTPRTNLGAICADDTPQEAYETASMFYWGTE